MWKDKVTELTSNKSLMIFVGIVVALVIYNWFIA
jgi:hypothetical protein